MRPDLHQLRADIEALTSYPRPSASDGERRGAEYIAARLREEGLEPVLESERAHGTWHRPLAALGARSLAGGVAGLAGRRGLGALAGVLSIAGMVDEFDHGRHVTRRFGFSEDDVTNVWAVAGDPDAERTLVVYAHHDAAFGGAMFDSGPQRYMAELFPNRIEATDTSIPLHVGGLIGPALVALGSLTGRRRLLWAGLALNVAGLAMLADIERTGVVPGANDNLSGVAGVLAIARALRARPVEGLRVILLSAGAEESFQQGIRAWARRHLPALPDDTRFLNLESVGSPELALLEGEGPFVMRDYDATFKDEVAAAAADERIHLRRGLRARPSTDGTTPQRAGYATAVLVSIDWAKAISNYHSHADTPENLDYETIRDATAVAEAVIRRSATPASTRRPA